MYRRALQQIPQQQQTEQEINTEVIQIGVQYQYDNLIPAHNANNVLLYPVGFYKFTIQEIQSGLDLFVVLKAIQDQSTFPALYMSQSNEHPSMEDGISCGLQGMDVCSIDPDTIQIGQVYYLGVYCAQNCKYTLRVHYQQEEYVRVGEGTILEFRNETEKLFKIRIPNNIDGMDRILIKAHFLHERGKPINDTFYFYVNRGNDNPSPAQHEYIADEIWGVGKGVVIHKQYIVRDSNLTMVIVASSNVRVYLTSITYPALRPIYLFDAVDDMLGPNETNYYQLIVENRFNMILDQNSLSLDINPFEGNPDVYITPPPQPQSINEYAWQSQLDCGYESITISPKHRDSLQSNDSSFYIAISSNSEFSSYGFLAYISSYISRYITPLSTESGFLTAGEMMQYTAFFDYMETSTKFTFEAVYPQGSAYMILKKCLKNITEVTNVVNSYEYISKADPNNYYNCSITDQDIQISVMDELVENMGSILYASQDIINIYYNTTECLMNTVSLMYESYASNCQYIIGIVSNPNQNSIRYTILLKGNEQHIQLIENVPNRSWLMQYDSDYYVFENTDDTAIEVLFQIAVINGDLNAYGSQTILLPNATNCDQQGNMDLEVLRFNSNDSNLVGKYYIHIQSQSVTRYMITPMIIRSNMSNVQYIPLIEGEQQKLQLAYVDQIVYLSFTVDLIDQQPLFIHLNSLVGSHVAYIVSSPGIPKTDVNNVTYDVVLKSSSHTLILEQNDTHYVSSGSYRIAVYSLSHLINEAFEISYSTTKSLIELHYGMPYISSLSSGQSSYFYFNVNYQLEEIFIVKTQSEQSGNITVYVSTLNKYPTKHNHSAIVDGAFVKLNNISVGTTIYIGAMSSSESITEFSLLIRGIHSITQLVDGIIQDIPMPSYQQYKQTHLYYVIPNEFHTIQVQAASKFAELTILGSVVDYSNTTHQIHQNDRSIFPTQDLYQIKEIESSTANTKLLLLTSNNTMDCSKYTHGCILLLTVKINQDSMYAHIFGESHDNISNVTNVFGQDGYFSIVVSSQISTIKDGDTFIGYSTNNIMTYYKFIVPMPIDIIEVVVTPIGIGDPDVYLVKQNTTLQYEQLPTFQFYDYHSVQFRTDILQLMQEDFPNNDNSGEYIVGVAGFQEDVTYSITLNLADIQILTLLPNQPINHINMTGQYIYFRYNHLKKNSFRIIVDGISHVNVGINTLKGQYQYEVEKKGLIESLPMYGNHTNHTEYQYYLQSNDNLFAGILNVRVMDSQFCEQCTYLIGVEQVGNKSDLSILVAIDEQPLILQEGQQYIDVANSNGNQYLVNTESNGELHINVYSGEFTIYTRGSSKPSKTTYDAKLTSQQKIIIPIEPPQMYVYILPQAESKYIMNFNTIDSQIQLQLGKSYRGNSNGSMEFNFEVISGQHLYTVQAQTNNGSCTIDVYSMNKTVIDYVLVQPIDVQSTIDQCYNIYLFKDDNAQYKVILNTTGYYTIMVSIEGTKYLEQNQKVIDKLHINQTQKYEVYGVENQTLHIEIIDCLGKTELTTNSHFNPDNSYTFTKDGDVFFEVNAIQSVEYIDSQLIQHFTMFNLIPHIGDYHKWILSDTSVKLDSTMDKLLYTIKQMQQDDTQQPMDIQLIQYTLHISNVPNYLMAFAGCNLDTGHVKKYQFENVTYTKLYHEKVIQIFTKPSSEDIVFKFDIPNDQNILYALVTLQVTPLYQTVPYTYFYPQSTIDLTKFNTNQNPKDDNTVIDTDESWFTWIQKQGEQNQIIIITILAISILLLGYTILRCCLIKYRQRKAKNQKQKPVEEDEEKADVNKQDV